jgi:hypothetical protein
MEESFEKKAPEHIQGECHMDEDFPSNANKGRRDSRKMLKICKCSLEEGSKEGMDLIWQ